MKIRKPALFMFGILCILSVLLMLAWRWIDERRKNARAIAEAMANPRNIDPEKLLNEIDMSFRSLGAEEKRKILDDAKMTDQRVATATGRELAKSFKLIFQLPEPVRKRIIRESADNIQSILKNHAKEVDDFFDSPAGNGVMTGVSSFFLFGLSGKEKAEAMPLTQAMFEMGRKQAERRRK